MNNLIVISNNRRICRLHSRVAKAFANKQSKFMFSMKSKVLDNLREDFIINHTSLFKCLILLLLHKYTCVKGLYKYLLVKKKEIILFFFHLLSNRHVDRV